MTEATEPEVFGLEILTPEVLKALAKQMMGTTDIEIDLGALGRNRGLPSKMLKGHRVRAISPESRLLKQRNMDADKEPERPARERLKDLEGTTLKIFAGTRGGDAFGTPKMPKKPSHTEKQDPDKPTKTKAETTMAFVERVHKWGEHSNQRKVEEKERSIADELKLLDKGKIGERSRKLARDVEPICNRVDDIYRKREETLDRIRTMQEEKEMEDHPLRPTIHPRSAKLTDRNIDTWESWHEDLQEKITDLRDEQDKKRMEECTFKPVMCAGTEKLARTGVSSKVQARRTPTSAQSATFSFAGSPPGQPSPTYSFGVGNSPNDPKATQSFENFMQGRSPGEAPGKRGPRGSPTSPGCQAATTSMKSNKRATPDMHDDELFATQAPKDDCSADEDDEDSDEDMVAELASASVFHGVNGGKVPWPKQRPSMPVLPDNLASIWTHHEEPVPINEPSLFKTATKAVAAVQAFAGKHPATAESKAQFKANQRRLATHTHARKKPPAQKGFGRSIPATDVDLLPASVRVERSARSQSPVKPGPGMHVVLFSAAFADVLLFASSK